MNNMFKIVGNSDNFSEFQQFRDLGAKFLPFAHKRLGFNKPVEINLLSDPENAKNPLGKTAYYNPDTMKIAVFVDKRHVKDILRSLAHELVHHTQNCRGEFDGKINTGPGYAQEDGHMRKMEEEAYLEGQMLLRDWEDSIKKEDQIMSLKENKENVVSESQPGSALGLRTPNWITSWIENRKRQLELEKNKEREEAEKESMRQRREEMHKEKLDAEEARKERALSDPAYIAARDAWREEEGFFEHDLKEDLEMKKEKKNKSLDEVGEPGRKFVHNPETDEWGEESEEELMSLPLEKEAEIELDPLDPFEIELRKSRPRGRGPTAYAENWFKGGKDQLLFETLMKKWTK